MSKGKTINNKSIDKHREYVLERIAIDAIEPRSMLKLDDNFEEAMSKMERIQKIHHFLPGIDCGGCGTPSCRTLAEDIVQVV